MLNDFPFPGIELSEQELSYDYCYAKIPAPDRPLIAKIAWEKGAAAAADVFKQFNGERNFFVILSKSGLSCEWINKDYVIYGRRYFSEYFTRKKQILLYTKSVELWAEKHGMDREEAGNLILSHEYFHFLECTSLGFTSRTYQVPMLILGPLKIGRTGIRALSEIGAHGFARTYYELSGDGKLPGGISISIEEEKP
jgi:hypothetical protein